MKKKTLFYSFLAIILSACSPNLVLQKVKTAETTSITKQIPEEQHIQKIIEPYKIDLEKKMNIKIAYTPIDLPKTQQNSHLGNLLVDFTLQGARDWAKNQPQKITVDASIINIGGIRTSINKGNILIKHIYEVMPFENELVIVKLNGKDIEKLFKYYENTQRYDPVAGFYIETKDKKLIKGLINGKEPNPEKEYFIATSDYLALGGDNMDFFRKGEIIQTNIKLRDVFLSKMKEKNMLSFEEIEKRLQFHHTQSNE